MVLQLSKCAQHSLVQVVQVLLDLALAQLSGILELHAAQLVQDAAQVLLDDRPGDLVLRLGGGLDGAARTIVEADQIVQHEHGLVEGTEAIVGGVAVLLQEVVLEQLGHL